MTNIFSYKFPLRWDWKQFAYTDGSKLDKPPTGTGLGAAVHLPPGATPDNEEEQTVPIDPAGGHEGTINRAELAAIWTALTKRARHIATDSQGSIFQIQKMLHRPHDLKEHRHKGLLQSIVDLITQCPSPVTLYKVKAHMGIEGNEKADAMAKRVARGCELEGLVSDVPHSNDRGDQFWISHTPAPTLTEPHPVPQPLPTLDGHLHHIMHEQHRLGMADVTTSYYSHWGTAASGMMPVESNSFMTQPDITAAERRTTLQYRCGQLFSNKLGKRWGKTTTDRCPLCGGADGGHHIASGCSKLSKLYMARHHQAGRIILKAILSGQRAAEVAYADVGSGDSLARAGVPTLDGRHRIHLPKQSSRPDVIMAARSTGDRGMYDSITIVEIKYCRDSDPAQQLQRATEQHTHLQTQMAAEHSCTVQTEIPLLGVSGAIYTTYGEGVLKRLGVHGSLLKSTIRRLHSHAIRSLRGIVCTRRRLEKKRSTTSHGAASAGGKGGQQGQGEEPPASRRHPLLHRDTG